MVRPSYIEKYVMNWELTHNLLGGKSALDSRYFIGTHFDDERIKDFIQGYGLDTEGPIYRAELFGNFQESLQFIRRYFLKEGSSDGLDLEIPKEILTLTDIKRLFHMATHENSIDGNEIRLWAEIVLKVMHTILHIDKDLRSNYFSIIQTQIFDRFYKVIHRNEEGRLFLGDSQDKYQIELEDFQTKAKKGRDSTIIKLLHKVENVAGELFDRVGVRIVTKKKYDTMRALNFLVKNSIIIPHNIIPSRSVNSLFDLYTFREKSLNLIKKSLRKEISEDEFCEKLEKICQESSPGDYQSEKNKFSSKKYSSLQITCRYLIKYRNPFIDEFNKIRDVAREFINHEVKDLYSNLNKIESSEEQIEVNYVSKYEEMASRIMHLDTSLLQREIRFFYPSEVQIVDQKNHLENTLGEASHVIYKRSQVNAAMYRVFKYLLLAKDIPIPKEFLY